MGNRTLIVGGLDTFVGMALTSVVAAQGGDHHGVGNSGHHGRHQAHSGSCDRAAEAGGHHATPSRGEAPRSPKPE